jgi:hypothetical protein
MAMAPAQSLGYQGLLQRDSTIDMLQSKSTNVSRFKHNSREILFAIRD